MYWQLHNHSSKGSIRDSISDVEAIAKRVKDLGQLGYALTDHGSTSALLTSYKICKKLGLKFIFGLEAYITDSVLIKISIHAAQEGCDSIRINCNYYSFYSYKSAKLTFLLN